MMEIDMKNCLDYFAKLEESAQDILIDKERIIILNKRSNALREATRALQSDIKKDPNNKTWLCFGNMFIKCSKTKALALVEKDRSTIDAEINELRDNLRPKMENIRNLEGKPELSFNLKPLNQDELKAMRKILPNV